MKKILIFVFIFVSSLIMVAFAACKSDDDTFSKANVAASASSEMTNDGYGSGGDIARSNHRSKSNHRSNKAKHSSSYDLATVLIPSDARDIIEADGAITCVSKQPLNKLIAFYEDALDKIDADGQVATVILSGLDTWSWVGTYGEDSESLTISIATNPLGDGLLISIAYGS